VVLCVDMKMKAQIQAVERTQPVRRVWPGGPERRTHDYIRHGTTTLFAALEVATGRVTNRCAARHRHQEFLGFLKQLARTYPPAAAPWSATTTPPTSTPRSAPGSPATPHPAALTPTSASWLNLVEVFFSIVERQALRRGDFASVTDLIRRVTDLIAAISRFCAAWNECCQRFSWTKSADEILTKLNRQTTSATQH
jgi:hypothetical protein